jgi:PAS domain S-box-containing protein
LKDAYRVLIVEDEQEQAEMVQEFLRLSGPFITKWSPTVQDLWGHLNESEYDVILLDYKLSDGNGLSTLQKLRQLGFSQPVIMITGQGDERLAVQAMQYGAADYICKGSADVPRLPSIIQKSIRAYELQRSFVQSMEQSRYQALLLNNVRDAVVVWNTSSKITYWNPAAELLYGWRSKERIGLNVSDVYLNSFTPPVRVPPPDGTAGFEVERQYIKHTGDVIWISSRVSAMRDYGGGGRLIGFMDVARDITQRKFAEEALRQSQERYALATAAAKVGVWEWHLHTGVIYIDPNLKAMLGYRDSEIPNHYEAWSGLIYPDDRDAHLRTALEHARGKTPEFTLEHRMLHSDGSQHWVLTRGRRIQEPSGQTNRLVGTCSDITERKQMEQQIQATQARLNQAARLAAFGELAAGVAHHINNPLTTIIAETQLLRQVLPENNAARESADAIEQAGWRVQKTVQQLIDFSKPGSNTFQEISLNASLANALALVGDEIRSNGIQLVIELRQGLPPLRGNARQLGDLWLSLLMLARDATADGQAHTIKVRSERAAEPILLVEIWDDGRPIPGSEIETLFEPNLIKPTGGRGTGIELNICQEIVRQHMGEITAESNPVSGTIFRVYLPVEV